MVTDMVGYTALSQKNESRALELLRKHREIFRPVIAEHRGREIKTIGDAFLVEFDSALDAVTRAVELQRAVRNRNAGVPDPDPISIRIGIHVGDVIHQEGDVYGDAVNIASRIEPLAQSGGICISEQTFDQVRNKVPYELARLEPRELKNVSTRIDIYKIKLPWNDDGGGLLSEYNRVPLPADRIAVLPFVSISPDPTDEYFADGMTEELITSISLVKGLKVIARTSAMNYKKKEKSVAEIGRELGVGTIVEGSVRKAGDRIRVTIQVIDVNSEEHLWASNYDSKLDDIFAIQSNIAEKVAKSLPGALVSVKPTAVAERDTEDVTAYANFLQGRELMHSLLEPPLRQSLQFFENAVERDPRFARAYVGIARVYISLARRGFIPWRESIERANAFLDKAFSINRELAEAHSIRAELGYMGDDLELAESEARKAIELNPNLAEAYVLLGDIMAIFQKPQEWTRLLETAYLLDPLSQLVIEQLSQAYIFTGREADALNLLKRTQHLQPLNSHRWMCQYHMSKNNLEDAASELEELKRLAPTWEFTLFLEGFLAARKGDRRKAESVIASLERSHQQGWAGSSLAGMIYCALGEMDTFFEKMREAARNNTLRAVELSYSPLFASARADPRIADVFAISGLRWKPQDSALN